MLEKISNSIYYMLNDDEKDFPSLGLIVGKQCSMVIDAGGSMEHALHMQEEIKLLNVPPVKYVVLTHHHKDHIAGMMYWEGITIASKTTMEMIKKEYDNSKDYIIDILFQDELIIDLGGIDCKLYEITNPHRKDGTIIHVPSESTLFVGDACYGKQVNNHNYFERDESISMMNVVDSFHAEYVLCAHESICTKEEMESYFNNIRMAARLTEDCNDAYEAMNKYKEQYGKPADSEYSFFINSFFK